MAHVNNYENIDDYGNIDDGHGGGGNGNQSPRLPYPSTNTRTPEVSYLTYDSKCRLPFDSI